MKRRELIQHWSGNCTEEGHPMGKTMGEKTKRPDPVESTHGRWDWHHLLPSELINKGGGRDISDALL